MRLTSEHLNFRKLTHYYEFQHLFAYTKVTLKYLFHNITKIRENHQSVISITNNRFVQELKTKVYIEIMYNIYTLQYEHIDYCKRNTLIRKHFFFLKKREKKPVTNSDLDNRLGI